MRRLLVLMFAVLWTVSACNLAANTPIPATPGDSATNPTQTPDILAPTSINSQPTLAAQPSATPHPGGCILREDWPQYTVQPGDTLTSIAERTGSTADQLTVANCLVRPDFIDVGSIILVPRLPDSSAATRTYASSQYGITFSYPSSWTVQDVQGLPAGGIVVSSFDYDPNNEIPEAAWTLDMVVINFAYIPPEIAADPLGTWVQQEKATLLQNPGIEIIEEEQMPLPDGVDAYRIAMVSGSGHRIDTIYTIIGGRHFTITIRGNFGLADAVLNTLRAA